VPPTPRLAHESRSILNNVLGTASATGNMFLGLSPWVPAAGPHSCAQITADWLTESITPKPAAARVEHFQRIGGTSGTTDRNVLQLGWNAAGREASMPETVFVKTTPIPPQNRAMLAVLGMAKGEVEFYRTARPQLEGLAPLAYVTQYGPGGRQMLLLEDLTAQGASMFALAEECPIDHAFNLVEALAQLHGTFWETPRFATDMSWAVPHTQRPGFALMHVMFKYCRRHIIKNADKLNTSAEGVRLARLLNRSPPPCATEILTWATHSATPTGAQGCSTGR